MPKPAPAFIAGHEVLQVDTTRPQRRAIAEGKIRLCALSHGHYPGRLLPPMILPGLSSIGHFDAQGEQNWGMEPHRNEGVEICLLETGRMGFTVNGQEYRLTDGDITMTSPWQLHCVGNPHLNPGRLHWLILDVGVRRPNQKWLWPAWIMLSPAEKRELTKALRHINRPVWKSTADLKHAFREVAACVERYNADRPLTRLKLHINHLLLSLLEAIRQQDDAYIDRKTDDYSVVEQFLHALRDDFQLAAQPWTTALMASHCNMGTTKFSKLCHNVMNTSPWDYLIECRLQWASRQLGEMPTRSVTQIALSCGFSSGQYFALCFHKRFHDTPRDYRKRSRKPV